MENARPLPGMPDVACQNADTEGELSPPLVFGEGRRRIQHGNRGRNTQRGTRVFYPGSGRIDRVIPYVLHIWIYPEKSLDLTRMYVSQLPGSCLDLV
jgi:hypothetical protein